MLMTVRERVKRNTGREVLLATQIGVPREIKPLEGRVALIPEACAQLVAQGHQVYVEKDAGLASGYPDAAYEAVGVQIQPDAASLYAEARLIVKVKEPIEAEWSLLRREHLLFCFLHLAAEPRLAQTLCDIGLTAIAFETVQEDGQLPLLAPMSEIAGRIAIQIGSHLLHAPAGGSGLLLGGIPGTERGEVVVIGCGNAGMAAADLAARMGARVTVFDLNRERLAAAQALGANVTGFYPYPQALAQAVQRADLVIGAVLITGARAPHVVSAAMVRSMQRGSVIVDVSVDQGGCVETTQPRTYADPTYVVDGVTHFTVTNMPGAVPVTATRALCAAIMPYVLRLAEAGWERHASLHQAVNIHHGENLLATRLHGQ